MTVALFHGVIAVNYHRCYSCRTVLVIGARCVPRVRRLPVGEESSDSDDSDESSDSDGRIWLNATEADFFYGVLNAPAPSWRWRRTGFCECRRFCTDCCNYVTRTYHMHARAPFVASRRPHPRAKSLDAFLSQNGLGSWTRV